MLVKVVPSIDVVVRVLTVEVCGIEVVKPAKSLKKKISQFSKFN